MKQSLPVYPPDGSCLMCGHPLELGMFQFHPIMDGAEVSLVGGRIEFDDTTVVMGLFHDACFAAGITFDFEKLIRVMREARDNLYRGDF